MGLVGWVKGVVIRREAKQAGEAFAGNGGRVLDWMRRHKAKWGYVVGVVAAWCAAGCGEIPVAAIFAALGVPITGTAVVSPIDLIHKVPILAGLTCSQITLAVGVVSAFLIGAGVLTSDHHENVIQGLRPPAGPPKDDARV